MKRCIYCNFDNDENATFCNKCGGRLPEPRKPAELSESDIANGFNSKYGYGRLKTYNTNLFTTCTQAKEQIDDMPCQTITKVCIIIETLARDYYREAIYCKTVFSVKELMGEQPLVDITEKISDIIQKLFDAQLIPDEIKDEFLGITKTRNSIDYGTEEEISRITRHTAEGIYYSGERVADFFLDAIKNEPTKRYELLKTDYPHLYHKASEATELIERGDMFSAVRELGNLLRGLCCELYAKYKNIEIVRSVKFENAIELLSACRFITPYAEAVIGNISETRNKHHDLKEEISEVYEKNAYIISSRLTVYLLDKLEKAPMLRLKAIEHNTAVYNDIINNFLFKYKNKFEKIKHLNVFQCRKSRSGKYFEPGPDSTDGCVGLFCCSDKSKNDYLEYDPYSKDHITVIPRQECEHFYCVYPDIYSFQDYVKERYPNVSITESSLNYFEESVFSPDYNKRGDPNRPKPRSSYYKFAYEIEKLKTIPEISERYEQCKMELAKESAQAEEENRRNKKAQTKNFIRDLFVSILVPIVFFAIVLGGLIITDYLNKYFSIPWGVGIFNLLWFALLYAAMLVLSYILDCLGPGRVILGVVLCAFCLLFIAFWGLYSICLPGIVAICIWDLILWIFYRIDYYPHD